MFDLDFLQNIWTTITRNKWRSVLTAFGVFWGIFMLVVLSGVGDGMQREIMQEVDRFAINSTFIFSGQTSEPYKGFDKGRQWSMTLDDIEAINQRVPGLKYLSGVIFGGSSTNNTVRNDKTGTFQVMGFSPDYNYMVPSHVLEGRFINDVDMQEHRKVCVIGKKVKNDLFASDEQALGAIIRVNGVYYTVVGVVEAYSQNMQIFGPPDEMICIPFTTMQLTLNMGKTVHSIAVTAHDDVDITMVEDNIKSLLKERHMIAPTDMQAVDGFNLKMIFTQFKQLGFGITILIWIVGLGSLFAGVVGVSNIMLITVRERTQEIGILRALGASPRSIMTQIMSESMLLTSLAGLTGLIFGVGVLGIINMILEMSHNPDEPSMMSDPQVSFSFAVVALTVIIISGLFAGMLPANRALKIKPVEALQDE